MQTDKLLHLLVGALIVSASIPFIGIYSLLLCFIIAAAKEIRDDTKDSKGNKRGTSDYLDFWYTYLGGAVSMMFFYLVSEILS